MRRTQGNCRSWLACDAGDAVCLEHRRDAIAGKPAPTGFVSSLPFLSTDNACGSWLASDAGDAICLKLRGDAIAGKPAPTGFVSSLPFLSTDNSCGSWLASDAGDAVCLKLRGDAIAGKPAPTVVAVRSASGFHSRCYRSMHRPVPWRFPASGSSTRAGRSP
jgi:hypothetical protein